MKWGTQQITAKERFKGLIVETIRDVKTHYTNLQYPKFINAVDILDCLMESYKDEPKFVERAGEILKKHNITEEKLKAFAIIIGTDEAQQKNIPAKIQTYRDWFRALVDLANRTVFAGKQMNVNIDLAEVITTWNKMRGIIDMVEPEKRKKEIEEKSTMATDEQQPEPQEEAEDVEIEVIQ